MPTIDLFNIAADEAKITEAINDHTFKFGSKQFVKYVAKNFAQGAVIGGVVGLAIIGATAVILNAVSEALPEETE